MLSRPWGRYPEFVPEATIKMLSKFAEWPEEGILVGNGSNELIQASLTVTLGTGTSDRSATADVHAVQTDVDSTAGGRHDVFMNPADMTFDVDRLIEASRSADVVVVCNPNNPTGTLLERDALIAILKAAKGLVLRRRGLPRIQRTNGRSAAARTSEPGRFAHVLKSDGDGRPSVRLPADASRDRARDQQRQAALQREHIHAWQPQRSLSKRRMFCRKRSRR